jgi:hypothetical protein
VKKRRAIEMLRKFKVTYLSGIKLGKVEIEAYSKYNAKRKFRLEYPGHEIVRIEEVEE